MSKLQEQRDAAGLTRQKLSEKSGVNARLIERYEQGERDINGAKLKTLLRLCAALGCELKDIVDDEETLNLLSKM